MVLILSAGAGHPLAVARTKEPPDARLRTGAGSQLAGSDTYCWPYNRENYKVTICKDSFTTFPHRQYLVAERGERTRFEILYREGPDEVTLDVYRPVARAYEEADRVAHYRLAASLRPSWEAALKTARYALILSASWKTDARTHRPKSASWQFGVDIRRSVRRAQTQARKTPVPNAQTPSRSKLTPQPGPRSPAEPSGRLLGKGRLASPIPAAPLTLSVLLFGVVLVALAITIRRRWSGLRGSSGT